jgi:GGDEF domain-containing protein
VQEGNLQLAETKKITQKNTERIAKGTKVGVEYTSTGKVAADLTLASAKTRIENIGAKLTGNEEALTQLRTIDALYGTDYAKRAMKYYQAKRLGITEKGHVPLIPLARTGRSALGAVLGSAVGLAVHGVMGAEIGAAIGSFLPLLGELTQSPAGAIAAYRALNALDKVGQAITITNKARPIAESVDNERGYVSVGKEDSPAPVPAQQKPVDPAANVVGDRRNNIDQRKRVNEMTAEEKDQALLRDDLTGLGSERHYNENYADKPVQFTVDLDGLKWANDNLGYVEGGDQLLKDMGAALKESGLDASRMHAKGDEFGGGGLDKADLENKLKIAQNIFKTKSFEVILKDGTVVRYQHPGFSFGIAEHADPKIAAKSSVEALHANKEERTRLGIRAARGEEPPGISRQYPAGSKGPIGGQQGPEAAGAVSVEGPKQPIAPNSGANAQQAPRSAEADAPAVSSDKEASAGEASDQSIAASVDHTHQTINSIWDDLSEEHKAASDKQAASGDAYSKEAQSINEDKAKLKLREERLYSEEPWNKTDNLTAEPTTNDNPRDNKHGLEAGSEQGALNDLVDEIDAALEISYGKSAGKIKGKMTEFIGKTKTPPSSIKLLRWLKENHPDAYDALQKKTTRKRPGFVE